MFIKKCWCFVKHLFTIIKIRKINFDVEKDILIVTLSQSVCAIPMQQKEAYLQELISVLDSIFGKDSRILIQEENSEIKFEVEKQEVYDNEK